MTLRFGLRVFVGVAILMFASSNASAYCRKRAIPLAVRKKYASVVIKAFTNGVCEDDQVEEFKTYPWIYWPSACTSFSVSTSLPQTLSAEAASSLTALAFSQWSGSRCDEVVGDARPSIDVRDLGTASCSTVGYDATGGPNQNLIVYQANWDKVKPNNLVSDADTLGLTTVSYDDSGRILDADMRINMQINPATADPVASEKWDLREIVTHEAGHFLGFAHSGEESAVMYYSAVVGETKKRYLADDDRVLVCTTYRPGGTRAIDPAQNVAALPCNPSPAGGFTEQCQAAPSKCSATPAAQSSALTPWLVLGSFVGVAQMRRRRCRTSTASRQRS